MTRQATKAVRHHERPILFSGPMVRAILEGRKTQTRRVVKIPHDYNPKHYLGIIAGLHVWEGVDKWGGQLECPYGQPGDRLWVRESFGVFGLSPSGVHLAYKARLPEGKTLAETDGGLDILSVGTEEQQWAMRNLDCERWKPAIHMPRWASRIILEIINIRVERLQVIALNDCYEEGIERPRGPKLGSERVETDNARGEFRSRWNTLNAKRGYSWESNPWVWVITFRRINVPERETET